MSKKTLTLFTALVLSSVFVFSVPAQDQNTGPALGSSSSSVDNQGIGLYLLGPGDVLDVRVFGQPDLSSLVEIDSDGNISSLPFVETPIRAQCRTQKEVQKEITLAFSKYIRSPQVSVRIADRKSRQPATISGAVRAPMQVIMMRRARLHELVTKAGGWTDRASGTIQVMHTEPEMCPAPGEIFQKTAATSKIDEFGIAIYKLNDLKVGKESADPYIRPGDIVIVTEGDPVYVTGAVIAPRELVLRDKLTLGRAIAMAGGVQKLADTGQVHIYRQRDDLIGQEDLKYNYDEIKKGKAPDVLLQPYDIVDVRGSGIMTKKGFLDLITGTFRTTLGAVTQRGIIY